MKKKLYIHAGPPKTATSVLQWWFNENHNWLYENGIYYPSHNVDKNKVSSGHYSYFLEPQENKRRAFFNHEKFNSLLEIFEFSKLPIFLLSSEYFFYQFSEFLKYKDLYDIKFITYVRPDFELIESLYNQSVKRGKQTQPISLQHILPQSSLDELINYITVNDVGSNFILRAYGDETVFSGNIILDFLSIFGLDELVAFPSVEVKVNLSYSFESLEFKRWINKFNLEELDGDIDQCLQNLPNNGFDYSLLPLNIYNGYKLQSLNKVILLNEICEISNFDKLLNYIKTKDRPSYIHQNLYDKHLKKVVEYMHKNNESLLISIFQSINCFDLSQVDLARLKIFEQALASSSLNRNKSYFSTGFFGKLRKKIAQFKR